MMPFERLGTAVPVRLIQQGQGTRPSYMTLTNTIPISNM